MSVRSGGEPLTEREIRVLRGMIDQYEYDENRQRFFHGVWTSGKAFLLVLAAVVTMVAQIATMIAVFTGGH